MTQGNSPSLTSPLSHPHEKAAGPSRWILEHALQEGWPNSDPLGANGATCIRSIQGEETILIFPAMPAPRSKRAVQGGGISLGPHPVLVPGREDI